MATVDRFVRQVRRYLHPGEGLLATLAGREPSGRRRVGVVATDRRLLVVTVRPEPPAEFAYGQLEIICDTVDGGALLALRTADDVVEIARIADLPRARLLVDLVDRRLGAGGNGDRLPRVRIVS